MRRGLFHLWLICAGLLWGGSASGAELQAIRTVVLDPGHGGAQDGTRSDEGVLEKELALQIAYLVRERLQRDHPGLRVILTRNLDVDLSLPERLMIAHEARADLFISLHLNAAPDKEAAGIEVYYLRADKATPLLPDQGGTWGKDFEPPAPDAEGTAHPQGEGLPLLMDDLERGRVHKDSALLAELLLDELGRACAGRALRGVRQENFGVLRGARVPSVVVELGFLSNAAEAKWLVRPENHERFARAISRAVERVDEVFVRKNYLLGDPPP